MSEAFKSLFDGLSNGEFASLFSGKFNPLSIPQILIILAVSLVLGGLLSVVYTFTTKKEGSYVRSFSITLIILPAIIATILSVAAMNIYVSIGLAGTFSIIRYRSLPGDSKEIAYIFFTMVLGVTLGTGYVLYAVIFALIMYAVMIILAVADYGKSKADDMVLKMHVPENLNFDDICNDLLEKYTVKSQLNVIKTKEFGAVYELIYDITMKKGVDKRQFIDELRCRNGNLNIQLLRAEYAEKQKK